MNTYKIRDGFTWAIAVMMATWYILALSLFVGFAASMVG